MTDSNQTHFWITSHPFCEAMLFLCPQNLTDGRQAGSAQITIFDCDGGVVNEADFGSSSGSPVAIELDPLMERCKLESGLRHGHLRVRHDDTVRAVCRLQNRGGAVVSGSCQPVSQEHAMFSPVTLSPERSSLIALVNFGSAEAQVRVRLMFGNRSPDVVYPLLPYGSKVICLEKEFLDVLTSGFGKPPPRRESPVPQEGGKFPETRAYVRVSLRNDQQAGAQLIECTERGEQGTIFSALSW